MRLRYLLLASVLAAVGLASWWASQTTIHPKQTATVARTYDEVAPAEPIRLVSADGEYGGGIIADAIDLPSGADVPPPSSIPSAESNLLGPAFKANAPSLPNEAFVPPAVSPPPAATLPPATLLPGEVKMPGPADQKIPAATRLGYSAADDPLPFSVVDLGADGEATVRLPPMPPPTHYRDPGVRRLPPLPDDAPMPRAVIPPAAAPSPTPPAPADPQPVIAPPAPVTVPSIHAPLMTAQPDMVPPANTSHGPTTPPAPFEPAIAAPKIEFVEPPKSAETIAGPPTSAAASHPASNPFASPHVNSELPAAAVAPTDYAPIKTTETPTTPFAPALPTAPLVPATQVDADSPFNSGDQRPLSDLLGTPATPTGSVKTIQTQPDLTSPTNNDSPPTPRAPEASAPIKAYPAVPPGSTTPADSVTPAGDTTPAEGTTSSNKSAPTSGTTNSASQPPPTSAPENSSAAATRSALVTPAARRAMDAVLRKADIHVQRGIALADRRAYYAARTEFLAALRLLAQGLDAQEGGTARSEALAHGVWALEEVNDFIPRAGAMTADLRVERLVVPHRTNVLKPDGKPTPGVTPLQAVQQYYTFAQDQLAAAVHPTREGSLVLTVLGKLYTSMEHEPAHLAADAKTKGLVCQQAALIVDANNVKAANELAVILARESRFEEARNWLVHSLTVKQQVEAWHNLAVVHESLGETKLAQSARYEGELLTRKSGAATGPRTVQVKQVSPAAFAANSPTPQRPSQTAAATSTQPQPQTAAKPSETKSPWSWLPWR